MESKNIKQAGLKVTKPRLKILNLFDQHKDKHLSAEDIYTLLRGEGEDIGLATVYRVLTQFVAAGLVERHYFESGQAVFELTSDEHHDHMVCVKTGRVVEFYDETIEQRQKEIAAEHGFVITDHSLTLYGEFSEK